MDIKRYIHESNMIEGIDDPHADADSLTAWMMLINRPNHTEPIEHGDILRLQDMVTGHQTDLAPNWRGHYRNSVNKVNVMIAGRAGVSYSYVEGYMDNWLIDLKDSKDPIDMHIRFEKIHPFADGNGRTGRMLLWWHEIRLGQEPTLFLASEKHEKYYPLFP